jgi:hypothetical protein
MILYLKRVKKSTIIDKMRKTLWKRGVKKSTIMDEMQKHIMWVQYRKFNLYLKAITRVDVRKV